MVTSPFFYCIKVYNCFFPLNQRCLYSVLDLLQINWSYVVTSTLSSNFLKVNGLPTFLPQSHAPSRRDPGHHGWLVLWGRWLFNGRQTLRVLIKRTKLQTKDKGHGWLPRWEIKRMVAELPLSSLDLMHENIDRSLECLSCMKQDGRCCQERPGWHK